jgi:hypothetical protein
MQKRLLFIFILTNFIFLRCGYDNKNKQSSVKISHKFKEEKEKLGDTLFLDFRENMTFKMLKRTIKKLIHENKLEYYGSNSIAFRFLINDLEFIMPIDFCSKGTYFELNDTLNQANFLLDEIILNETECSNLYDNSGDYKLIGECFKEIFRKNLLNLYLSKYKFKKLEKTIFNQMVARTLTDEEHKKESLKPKNEQHYIKIIDLPNGKSILHVNEDDKIIIKCGYGYSEHNIKFLEFKKIEIRYLSQKRIESKIIRFNESINKKNEEDKRKLDIEKKREARKKDIYKEI